MAVRMLSPDPSVGRLIDYRINVMTSVHKGNNPHAWFSDTPDIRALRLRYRHPPTMATRLTLSLEKVANAGNIGWAVGSQSHTDYRYGDE